MSKKPKQEAAREIEPVVHMYCGPNIPGVANPGFLFTEAPPRLKEHLEKCAPLKTFIIDPKEYARVKQAITKKGSIENVQYQKAAEYLTKGR